MGYIGKAIFLYRNQSGISRQELSENICTEQYLYLVEKGKRNPSAEIIRLLGFRMGIDFFRYYEYLECENPIKMEELIEEFHKYRFENNQVKLMELNEKAKQLPDFNKIPWKYELEINEISYLVLHAGEIEPGYQKAKQLREQILPKYRQDIYYLHVLLVISVAAQLKGDLNEAKEECLIILQLLQNKMHLKRYAKLYISIKINYFYLLYKEGRFEEIKDEALKLEKYQRDNEVYDLLHYTYFHLASSFYYTGDRKESIYWYVNLVCLLIINHRKHDFSYLMRFPVFTILLNSTELNGSLRDNLLKIYDTELKPLQ